MDLVSTTREILAILSTANNVHSWTLEELRILIGSDCGWNDEWNINILAKFDYMAEIKLLSYNIDYLVLKKHSSPTREKYLNIIHQKLLSI